MTQAYAWFLANWAVEMAVAYGQAQQHLDQTAWAGPSVSGSGLWKPYLKVKAGQAIHVLDRLHHGALLQV